MYLYCVGVMMDYWNTNFSLLKNVIDEFLLIIEREVKVGATSGKLMPPTTVAKPKI